jgi:hypothetical protein
VAALYQSSQEQFVAERKRLATELKANGDKAGAAQLAKLPRPPLSAWAVNQLWWHAREAFDALLESADRLRNGEREAAAAHRDALLTLRGRAALLLAEAGHAVTDATLRRVTTTLTALAASGGFEPDAPGALAADRDPPGFEALGSVTQWSATHGSPLAAAPSASTAPAKAAPEPHPEPRTAIEAHGAEASHPEASATLERRRLEAEAAARAAAERDRAAAEAAARVEQERRRAAEEERRRAEERAQRAAERMRLEAERSAASAALQTAEHEAARLRSELESALEDVARQRAALNDIEARLKALAADVRSL